MIAFARLVVRQRAAVILLAVIVLIAGALTAGRLQLELLPNVNLDTVTIVTPYPGAAPDTVLKDVTKPIEAAVASVPGLDTLQSTSAENASVVVARFTFGTDVNQAQAKIATAVSGLALPQGTQAPRVSMLDFSAFPILYYGVTSTNRNASLQQTYALVKQQIAPQIEQVPGVAAADVGGGVDPQVTVTLDPRKLARYNLTVAQVDQVLQANSVRIPAGTVTNNGLTEPVVTAGTLTTLAQLRGLPVGVQMPAGAAGMGQATGGPSGPGQPGSGYGQPGAGSGASGGTTGRASYPATTGGKTGTGNAQPGAVTGASAAGYAATPPHVIHLRDVATINRTHSDINTLGTTPGEIAGVVRYNGVPAISITIRKNSDANIVQVADGVNAKIQSLRQRYPGLRMGRLYDSSTSIKDSVTGLVKDGVFGAVFAVLIIFVFLLTVRSTLVTAVSIPLSILTAIIVLGARGITLNLMTISAIAIAVGRVVDDAIVVLENIYRHVQAGEERLDAVVHGTREVARAIIGSTITTVCVFLPIGYIGGILGQFFQPFALTVTIALVASLVVALTVVPALSSLFVRKKDRPERDTAIQRVYIPILVWSLGHRAITLVVALLLFIGSLGLTTIIPKGFFPASSEAIAQLGVNLPAGASLDRTSAVVTRIEQHVVARQPGIAQWETIIGYDNVAAQRGGSSSASNAATLLVVYRAGTDMTTAMSRFRSDARPYETGGVVISGAAVQSGPPSNVDVQVSGTSQADVAAATRQVLDRLRGVSGLTNLQSNLQARKPQVEVTVDAVRAFQHGLTPATVALQVRQMLTGQTVSTIRLNGESQDVNLFVRVDPRSANTAARLSRLTLGTPPAPLSSIASVRASDGPVQIGRQNQQGIGEVTASVNDNVDASKVTAAVAKAYQPLVKTWAARNVTIGQAGLGKQLTDGFINMGYALLIAVGLVYLVMVMIFRSLLIPFVILFALPLAVIGALVALAVTHRTLDMSAMIGVLMLVGIVVTNAIVLLDLVQHKVEAGEDLRQALVEGGRTRVRPILMTALATVLALLPLAFSSTGGLIAANLATVVIGGLLTSTGLTLVVMPVLYSVFTGMRRRIGGNDARGASTARAEQTITPSVPERVAISTER